MEKAEGHEAEKKESERGEDLQAKCEEPRSASATDPVKLLLPLFRDCLNNGSSLGSSSIDFTVRFIGDILRYSFERKNEDEIDGMSIVMVFTSFGSSGSFLNRKDGNLSGNYCGKLLMASLRALALLRDPKTDKRWATSSSVADATESYLKNLQKRYQRVEKREREHSLEKRRSPMC